MTPDAGQATFLPHTARIVDIVPESSDTRTFVLSLEPPVAALDAARPGQFVMLSILGHGEAAFTLTRLLGAGAEAGTAVLTVRRVGRLTSALFALAPGARVGLRGPFGCGFPAPDPTCPTLYVAGGCGLAPLRPAIEAHLALAPRGPLGIVCGAREPASRIYRDALARWATLPDVWLAECVEQPDATWRGSVGIVSQFIDDVVSQIEARRAVLCGPPSMLARVTAQLVHLRLAPDAIHVALERHMQCGVGLCGHCYVNHRYVCTDGPVFSLAELRELPDAFSAECAGSAA